MAGERNYHLLWLTVIHNASEEAAGRNLVASGKYREKTIQQARSWLTQDSPGLRRACEFAGVQVDKVIKRFSKKYKEKK
jgi:sigma54-dependent transcription regulator